jgi:hypothetical protein
MGGLWDSLPSLRESLQAELAVLDSIPFVPFDADRRGHWLGGVKTSFRSLKEPPGVGPPLMT